VLTIKTKMARQKTKKRSVRTSKKRPSRLFLPYPLIIFLLVCAGVFLVGWTLRSGASDIFVTAKVSAPFVTDPAIITSPADNSRFSSVPIQVSGDCPTNIAYEAAYVEIFDNGVMRGTALCDAGFKFSLLVDLFPDTNTLTAHVFNKTDDEGPVSAPTTVFYDVPQPPAGQPSKPTGTTKTPAGHKPVMNQLQLLTTFVFKGYHIGDTVEWPVSISGGTAPYAISVDWGDDSNDLISRSQSGEFKISHTYSKQGGYKDSYIIKVKASDTSGGSAFMQFFVIVTPTNILQASNIYSKPIPPVGGGLNWLWVAWPVYGLVMLMALSYMLGEKEELIILRRRGQLKHR
jgi:hypothetical protein